MKQSILKDAGQRDIHVSDFDSINDLYNYLKTATTNRNVFTTKESSKNVGSKNGWEGTATYEDAEQLLLNGWDEGAKKLTSQVKIDNIKNHKEVKRAIFDVVGFQASVPRYLQGVPQNMINKKSIKQKQKIVTLYKSIDYNASYSAQSILEDSSKFVNIVKEIEKHGVRVNAYVIWHAQCGNEQVLSRIKIKSASERVNISKMSFPLMHPSMLRRFMFRLLECEKRNINQSWRGGYGSPGANTKHFMKENEFFIPIMSSENKIKEIVAGFAK